MQLEAPRGGVILRKDDLVRTLGVSRSWLDRAAKEGRFPKPVQLSARSVGWLSSEVDAWLKARASEREVTSSAPGASADVDDADFFDFPE